MKKALILVSVIFLVSSLFANEYLVSKEDCWIYNSYSSRMEQATAEIKYESEFDSFFLKYDRLYISLSEDNLKDFRSACEKYFEWEKIAVENKAEIQKEIPIRIKIGAIWTTYSDDACMGVGELYFTFFSQDPSMHQLVISSTKIEDVVSGYDDTKLEDLYFFKDEVEKLYKDISEEKIQSYLNDVKKQQDVESLFN